MPLPTGCRYWVEGQTMWIAAFNNAQLGKENLYVQMPINRTSDLNLSMTLPDDILESVFNDCVMQLTKRLSMPRDVVNDNLPAGVTNVNRQGNVRPE